MEERTDQLIDTLQNAGLSTYQARAYVRLLELGDASATEIAQASDVPDARIYDVLRDLDDEGYIELYEQDTFKARVVDPGTIVEDLTDRAARLEDAAEDVTELWQRPSVDNETVSLVRRLETVLEAARNHVGDAEAQVHAVLGPGQFETLRETFAAAHDRGVTVDVTLLDTEENADVENFEDACTTVRRRPTPAPFLLVSDVRRLAFSPNPAAIEEYGLILENRSFAFVFFWHFLTVMWLPWPVAYSEGRDRTPRRYASLRQFLLEYEPLREEGATITVEIEGRDVETGEERLVAGTVVDTETGPNTADSLDSRLLAMSGFASLSVDTGSETIVVGGWGARREDVAARLITVVDVEGDPNQVPNVEGES